MNLLDFNAEMLSYDYMAPENDNDGSDRTDKAFGLYNASINDIRSGNDDIAFIKLKKAVSLKQDLFAAWLIIGLYTAKTGSMDKALQIFNEAAMKSKEYGETALRYIRALNTDKVKYNENTDSVKETRKPKINRNIVLLIIGIMAGVLLSLPLFLLKNKDPLIENDKEALIASLESELEQKNHMMGTLGSEMAALETEIGRLEKEIERLEGEDRTETVIIDLTDEEIKKITEEVKKLVKEEFREYLYIIELYYDNKILEAADRIIVFGSSNTIFTDELETELFLFSETLMGKAARYCEDRGVLLFGQGRYDESLAMLSRTMSYKADYNRMYRVYYYMGMDYLRKGEYEAAKEKFLKTRGLAPNTDWEGYADLRLRQIDELQSDSE